jgi:hypothetical protein
MGTVRGLEAALEQFRLVAPSLGDPAIVKDER